MTVTKFEPRDHDDGAAGGITLWVLAFAGAWGGLAWVLYRAFAR